MKIRLECLSRAIMDEVVQLNLSIHNVMIVRMYNMNKGREIVGIIHNWLEYTPDQPIDEHYYFCSIKRFIPLNGALQQL